MAKKMDLKMVLSMETRQFKAALRSIQTALNGFKMKMIGFGAAIAGGAGFADFGRKLVDTAKRLDQATTTLKNVSGGEFARNQEFLIGLANRYNQEIITLTGNFAKFTASCNEASMDLADQKKIFESLTRASAYFNLSADETNGVFLAVTQMVSKGKVSAEELRRQLGERLPGAFGLMAKAAGMTTEELDTALRQGKLMAADVLPKFADELNNVTSSLDTDTIQGWTNRLGTAMAELSRKMNLQGIYKSVVKFGAKTVQSIGNNIKTIQNLLVGLGTSMLMIFGHRKKQTYENFWEGQKAKINEYNDALHKVKQKLDPYENIYRGLDFSFYTKPGNYSTPKGIRHFKEGVYELSGKLETDVTDKKHQQEINKLMKEGNNIISQRLPLMREYSKRLSFWGKQLQVLKGMFARVLPTALFTAITTAISTIISKTWQLLTATKKVRKEYTKMNEEWEKFKNEQTPEMAVLKKYKDELNHLDQPSEGDSTNGPVNIFKKRELLISAINDMLKQMGATEVSLTDTDEHINEVLEERIKLLEKERNSREAMQQYTEAVNRGDQLEKERIAKQKELDEYLRHKGSTSPKAPGDTGGNWDGFKLSEELKAIETAIEENNKVKAERAKYLLPYGNSDDGSSALNDQQKSGAFRNLMDSFRAEQELLKKKLKEGAYNQDEYNSALKSLTSSTLDQLYEISVPESIQDEYDAFKQELIKLKNGLRGADADKFAKIIDDYNQKAKEYENLLSRNTITLDEYDELMNSLTDSTRRSLNAFDELPEGIQKFLRELDGYPEIIEDKLRGDEGWDKLMEQYHSDEEIGKWFKEWAKKNDDFAHNKPELKGRSPRFDYSKTQGDIAGEKAQNWQEYADALKNYIEEAKADPEIVANLTELENLLDCATEKAKDFKDAADLAKIKEDIKGYRKSLQSGILDTVSGIASAIDRLQNAMDKLNDPDITGWEKMVAILNVLIQTTETLLHTMEMFETITKVTKQLTGAQKSLAAVEEATTAASVAQSATKVAASQGEAIAGGAASAAKVPFPANIAAIAMIMGSLAAVFASIPKYATGGVVGGNSKTGDKILARLNSGELVLNKGQQNALLNQLNGNGGKVQFEIKGDRLVGVLQNYNRKMSK